MLCQEGDAAGWLGEVIAFSTEGQTLWQGEEGCSTFLA